MNFKKPQKIRSKKITQSAKGESCTLRLGGCNHNPETVVFAHISGNKGIATKNHDIFGCYACSECHSLMDSWKCDSGDKLRALQETQLKLVEKGLLTIK